MRLNPFVGSLLSISLATSAGFAGIRLPAIISDNMVLQQGKAAPVWGWAAVGDTVTVSIAGQKAVGVAGASGRWQVSLKPVAGKGPFDMVIATRTDSVNVKNVLAGDVWICSGQSNMGFQVREGRNSADEIANADWPDIRLFTVASATSLKPLDSCVGAWTGCAPKTVANFTAVGYFFGRDLFQDLKKPIGLINTSWGGTNCESWMSVEKLKSDTMFSPILSRSIKELADTGAAMARYRILLKKYEDTLRQKGKVVFETDSGNAGFGKGWASVGFNDSAWKTMSVPGYWEEVANLNIDGSVWFRKTLDIPAAWQGKDLKLNLGTIDDFDTTYFNGTMVGAVGITTPAWWSVPRVYAVPAKLVKPGKAVIAVRVFDRAGNGGFNGVARSMKLSVALSNPELSVPLAGTWKYMIEKAFDGSLAVGDWAAGAPAKPLAENDPNVPCNLFNAMINPLILFAITGAIWYQGENNAGRAYQYRKLLPAMIADWRERWNLGNFPFGIVSLANLNGRQPQPGPSDWAELREAQYLTYRSVPNTGLALAVDIGDSANIHPKNKQEVGRRLSLWALSTVYGRKGLEYSGPQFVSMKPVKDSLRLSFAHVGKGLVALGSDSLTGFAISNGDTNFVWASARISGNDVVVWNRAVKKPKAVRYAWAQNPACNLYNKDGLPAVPFRSDTLPGVTFRNR